MGDAAISRRSEIFGLKASLRETIYIPKKRETPLFAINFNIDLKKKKKKIISCT